MAEWKWVNRAAAVYYSITILQYFYNWIIGGGIAGYIAVVFLFKKGFLLAFSLLLVVSTSFIIAGIVFWLIKIRKQLKFLNPGVSIVKLVDTYHVITSNKFSFEKQITIKALQHGLDSYRTKFKWTGEGPSQVSIEPQNMGALHCGKNIDGMWDILRVQLNRPLNRKEKVSFILKFDLTDDKHIALPFFEKFVDDLYPKGFTMRVLLPNPPKIQTKEIFMTSRSDLPIYQNKLITKHHNSSEIKWRIKKPVIGRKYKLSWEL